LTKTSLLGIIQISRSEYLKLGSTKMLYSSAAEYAIRALTQLALNEIEFGQPKPSPVKELAEREGIPQHFSGKGLSDPRARGDSLFDAWTAWGIRAGSSGLADHAL
jgi:hypothetical protein